MGCNRFAETQDTQGIGGAWAGGGDGMGLTNLVLPLIPVSSLFTRSASEKHASDIGK